MYFLLIKLLHAAKSSCLSFRRSEVTDVMWVLICFPSAVYFSSLVLKGIILNCCSTKLNLVLVEREMFVVLYVSFSEWYYDLQIVSLSCDSIICLKLPTINRFLATMVYATLSRFKLFLKFYKVARILLFSQYIPFLKMCLWF